MQRVCLAIAAMWKDALGVETELVQMEFKAYLAARADPAQWDVVRVGWTADYNDASTFLDTMTRDSPQNFGRWINADYARLLDDAAAESDPARRRDTLQQAESLMLNDYPLLPVYFYVTRRLVAPRVVGAVHQPDEPHLLAILPPGGLVSERPFDLGRLDEVLEIGFELLLVDERRRAAPSPRRTEAASSRAFPRA